MTKQEQIEEMGKVMPEKIKDPLDNSRYIIFGKSLRREIARIYYNAGYRKISADTLILTGNQLKKIIEEEYKKALKGKVVLTTEEYQDLVVKSMSNFSSAMVEARKETAEKLLNDFKLWAREYQYKDTVVDENGERLMTNNEKLNYLYTYLCDKYKVEIKE